MFFKKKSIKLEKAMIPKNVAIIMDGNGRWAKKKLMPVSFGHSEGVKRIHDVIEVAAKYEIEKVTIYAFSTENWKRPKEEINHLMLLIEKFYNKELVRLIEEGIKVKIVGTEENVPADTLKLLKEMEEKTKDNTKLQLNIAFNYGSRKEIVDAVNKFIAKNPGKLIDENKIQENLYLNNKEDVDLLIRTSGEQRLSNYLLWQLCYSEFVFTETLWPDFDANEFEKCLLEYQNRNRRFGGR